MKTVTKKLYEAMFLVDSAHAAADWDGVNETIKNILERAEAEIVSQKNGPIGNLHTRLTIKPKVYISFVTLRPIAAEYRKLKGMFSSLSELCVF